MIIKSTNKKNFTTISNIVIRDKSISLQAKGLFLVLSSLPPDWKIHKTQVNQFSKDGKSATGRAFEELVKKGLITKKKIFRKNGKFNDVDYTLLPFPDFYKKQYKDYLLSEKWNTIKNNLFAARGRKCEVCGSVNFIEVHHKTYNNIFNEKDEDLQILCNGCHKKQHDII